MTDACILTINPGSTSTKSALYTLGRERPELLCEEEYPHAAETLARFGGVAGQADYRYALLEQFMASAPCAAEDVRACAALGGMLTPVPSGVIRVNQALADFSLHTPVYDHASNLGAPLAWRWARAQGIEAYIVDPVSVDEFTPVARLSGSPDFPRFSFVHALNIRACAYKVAQALSKPCEQLRCVAAHLGGGFSIAAFDRGRLVDNDNRMEAAPFTPERAGGVPPIPLVEACFSGRFSRREILDKLYGQGGVQAYLGTKDMRVVADRVVAGDEKAGRVYEAMIYQVAKQIGAMAAVLDFRLDALILTGGLTRDALLVERLQKKIGGLGRIFVYPGSNENEALATSVARVLQGRQQAMEWPV